MANQVCALTGIEPTSPAFQADMLTTAPQWWQYQNCTLLTPLMSRCRPAWYCWRHIHESMHPPLQPARCAFSLPLGCHPMRPSPIYTAYPILESAAYCQNRSHCKGIPPNDICITLSSIGSWVPATEPWWQIKWLHQQGLNPCLQHSRLTC